MKVFKKRLSIFLVFELLVALISTSIFYYPVKADSQIPENVRIAKEAHDAVVDYILSETPMSKSDRDDYFRAMLAPIGFIYGGIAVLDHELSQFLDGLLLGNNEQLDNTGKTDDEFLDEVTKKCCENISFNGYEITFNDTSSAILKRYVEFLENNCGYHYYYSYKLQDQLNSSKFNDGNLYNAVRLKLNELTPTGWCLYSYQNKKIFYMPYDDDLALLRTQNFTSYCYATFYSYTSWQLTDKKYYVYTYDSTNHVYNQSVSENVNSVGAGVQKTQNNVFGDYGVFLSSTDYNQLLVFDNLTALKNYSQGNKPYYTSDKWNTFMNNSGNYTVDSSNSNNVTYGDVTNYINNYYGNNGQYPSNPIINVYINNPDPGGSGGGSGGGGSGGGGSGGSSTGIFDFLSKIGEVLGNLIANLGNVLAELISGISEVISSVFEVVPNILTPLMHYVFGFLPDAIQSVIYLGIVCMLLLGVIQFLKR